MESQLQTETFNIHNRNFRPTALNSSILQHIQQTKYVLFDEANLVVG